jgi:hypothetical protein
MFSRLSTSGLDMKDVLRVKQEMKGRWRLEMQESKYLMTSLGDDQVFMSM